MFLITLLLLLLLGKILSPLCRVFTYIPEINHVPKEYSVAAVLSLLFMAPISLAPALAVMYFYISYLLGQHKNAV
jgi:hypothetical protein